MAHFHLTAEYKYKETPLPRWRYWLPILLEKLTGKTRYLPELEWSEKSWTHNLFRAYEWVFFREYGIRPEITATYDSETDTAIYAFHSLEAAMAHGEAVLRGLVPKFKFVKVYIPVLQPAFAGFGGAPRMKSPYLFAIAFDAANQAYSGSGTSASFSLTTSGSDRGMVFSVYTTNGRTITAPTYNSVSSTVRVSENTGAFFDASMFTLLNPATGANTAAVSINSSGEIYFHVTSYTGLDTTQMYDASSSVYQATGTTITATVTTIGDNCWTVAGFLADAGGLSAGTGSTQRGSILNGAVGIFDSNSAKTPAGSKSLVANVSNGIGIGMIVSIRPPQATNVTVNATVLTSTFDAPDPSISGGATVSASTPVATFSAPAPAISGGANVAPNALTATFSIPAVNIITPDSLVDAGVLTATFSTPAPSVGGGATVASSVLTATFSIPSASVQIDASIAATVLTATFTTPAPTIDAISNITVSPSALVATFSIPAPTVTGEVNAIAVASVLTATFSIPAPTVTAIMNVSVSASVLTATFSVQTPRRVGGVWTAQPRVNGDAAWTPQPRAV